MNGEPPAFKAVPRHRTPRAGVAAKAAPAEHPHLNPPPQGEEVIGPQRVGVNRPPERERKLLGRSTLAKVSGSESSHSANESPGLRSISPRRDALQIVPAPGGRGLRGGGAAQRAAKGRSGFSRDKFLDWKPLSSTAVPRHRTPRAGVAAEAVPAEHPHLNPPPEGEEVVEPQ